jgi:hypothetical protein
VSGRHAFGPRALKAPAEDGAVVSDPPLEAVGRLLADNRRAWEGARPAVLGIPWKPLRQEAREEVLALARDYLTRRGEALPPLPADGIGAPLLLAGHQPELFHPGVWVKNFALCGLAKAHRGVALNLIVDTDTVKSTSLRLPVPPDGEETYPRLLPLPFDLWAEHPYEEKGIADPGLFASFADRAGTVLAGWGYEPLLPSFWEEVLRQAEQTGLVGECFVGARRTFERAWGCHNLEVPVSLLCGTRAFGRFALHLLTELPRFHGLYNAALRAYRRAHGIRSRNHPVPELASDDGWREVPLWAWRGDGGRRGRLFARLSCEGIELRAGAEPWPTLPWEDLTGAWHGLVGGDFKVRPRALATTLFARLFVGDLFLHGLGGGKYDELTDEIVRRFYGLEPPGFATLSATRLLPLPPYPARPADRRRLRHKRRDLHFNPQRHLGPRADDPEYQTLLAERRAWLERDPADRAGRRQRFRALRDLNARLRAPLEARERELTEELGRCEEELKANAVLRRRDYAFCLYPESLLRSFLASFLCFNHE